MFSDTTKTKIAAGWKSFRKFLFQINCMHIRRRDINAREFYCPRCDGTFESDCI